MEIFVKKKLRNKINTLFAVFIIFDCSFYQEFNRQTKKMFIQTHQADVQIYYQHIEKKIGVTSSFIQVKSCLFVFLTTHL